METQNNSKPILTKEEFTALFAKLITKKKLIIRNSIIGAILGVAFALGVQKTWTSYVVLAPEVAGETSLGGGISSLAAMAGINLGGATSEAIYPELYPQMVASTPFVVDFLKVKVTPMNTDTTITFYDFITKERKRGWYEYPVLWFRHCVKGVMDVVSPSIFKSGVGEDIDPFYPSREQEALIQDVRSSMIGADVNKKDQLITLSVTTQDPLVSASLVDTLRVRLQLAITKYHTEKASMDAEYTHKMMQEAYEEYKRCRQHYTNYADTHMNPVLASVSSEEEDLENQMQTAYSTFTTLQQQYAMALAKVQECTPSFTIIAPSEVSVKPSSTPKIVVAFVWTFLFFIFTCLYVLVIDAIRSWQVTVRKAVGEKK